MRVMILALAAASAAFAATPDLSGTWKLNTSKSEFGQFPPPSSMTMKVTHADPKLVFEIKMAGDMGEMAFTTNCTTDGKECKNQGFGGSETKSVAQWDGETLVVETKGSFGDNNFTMKDKWALSEGGKVLTILRHWSSAMGDIDQKMTMEKQ
jgi:hypothetical protein